MNAFASWKRRRAETREKRRAEMQEKQQAKARSDEIDRQLEESGNSGEQNNVLLISSCSFVPSSATVRIFFVQTG
jgi:hypothetical protein